MTYNVVTGVTYGAGKSDLRQHDRIIVMHGIAGVIGTDMGQHSVIGKYHGAIWSIWSKALNIIVSFESEIKQNGDIGFGHVTTCRYLSLASDSIVPFENDMGQHGVIGVRTETV
ncbi:Hypothetical predicted protein [Mytilus galloprovincialis]|uniref:Uncharacterized protein n=1 Tax=Mytilus galloprovincialis TaxID=29158 RepID=A0A8B6HL27_MYTGA|nr:Hypothetical predicted protein [Mytilus galloprovincialis]